VPESTAWIGYRDGVPVEHFTTYAGAELALNIRRVQSIAPMPTVAVCNACSWEGSEHDVSGHTCPRCNQPDVNYFIQPSQT
jgi:hypothetical protein